MSSDEHPRVEEIDAIDQMIYSAQSDLEYLLEAFAPPEMTWEVITAELDDEMRPTVVIRFTRETGEHDE